ncbi:MAG: hypothetical protein AAGB11_03570, partial [Pseudomonadota bacterium]
MQPPKRWWRGRRWWLIGLGAVLLACLVRLVVAPVHLPLTGWVAGALTKAVGVPVRVGAVGVRLELSGIALAVDEVRLKSDVFSASVPRISVIQGFFGRTVRFDGPALRLDPSRGSGEPVPIPHPDHAIAALDAALSGVLAAGRERGIRQARVNGGRIDFVSAGRPINEARVLQNLTAEIDFLRAGEFYAELSMVGAEGPMGARLSRTLTEGAPSIRIEAEGFSPKDIVRAGPVREGFPVTLSIEADLSVAGEVRHASLDAAVGEGTVVFGKDPPRVMDGASLSLSRNADGSQILIDALEVNAGRTVIAGAGTLTPAFDTDLPWTFELGATDALLDPADNREAPVIADQLSAAGAVDFNTRLLMVEDFTARFPKGRFDASFTFDFSKNGPTLAGAARIGPSSINTLLAAWPLVAAHDPRRAIFETVQGGYVRGGDLVFALTPLELDGDPSTNDMIEGGMAIDIAFTGATVTTPELPMAVHRANGALRLRDKSLSVRLDRGMVPAGDGGP